MAQRISGTPGTLGAAPPEALPATAGETSPEQPWPLALLSANIKRYIDRMSAVWIEGQVIEFNRRGKVSYLTLRDLNEEMSLPVQVFANVLDRMPAVPEPGAHVVVNVKADFWTKAGRLSMRANDIRAVGLGELLARLERLRAQLGAEGLFDPAAKRALPFLPSRIGLITGRDSDAEKDVVRNARLRWPAVDFEIREVAVQGNGAVGQVMGALAELDADAGVDVIIIARGGGSLEDLLPFSNEALIRAVAAAQTPVVSAIGHEADRPLLDDVADLRASTPTDAAKRVVPDVAEEQLGILQARAQLDGALDRLLAREAAELAALRSRPVLAEPLSMITGREAEVAALRERVLRAQTTGLAQEASAIEHLRAQVRALSPLKTLERGYAVVQDEAGAAIRAAAELSAGQPLQVTVAHGAFRVAVTGDAADADTAHAGASRASAAHARTADGGAADTGADDSPTADSPTAPAREED